MSDIVERLRLRCALEFDEQYLCDAIECEAADEIKRLRSEIARLREERRWISVEERLPEVDSSILVAWSYEEDKEQAVSQAWYDRLGKFTNLEDMEFPGVTHWQPLPAPPKGGEVE